MVSITRHPGLSPDAARQPQEWLAQLSADLPAAEQAQLRCACALLQQQGLDESASQPYCQVLEVLTALRADTPTLIAALLHQGVTEGVWPLSEITGHCGAASATLIQAMSRMALFKDLGQFTALPGNHEARQQQLESLRRMLLAMAEDARAVLIRLAERLIEMRHLRRLPLARQHYLARETLEIYAPLANRLGIGQIKWELEDLSLRTLEPDAYREIALSLAGRRLERERYLHQLIDSLRSQVQKLGIQADVAGRPKHLYSIWRKRQRKNVDISQIFDALAVRVLVDDLAQCYSVLGLVHSLWPPIAGEFDDYIAAPKQNGYRSLHTAVIGPEGRHFEVQIRTREMHRLAELGAASHWRYKEGVAHDPALEQKISALRQLLVSKEAEINHGASASTALASTALASTPLSTSSTSSTSSTDSTARERIYVLTPHGKVIELPAGATPLDFAYAVHTSLGHRCKGARVNQRIVPLNYKLHNGEQVDIIAATQERPSRDWLSPQLGFLGSARSRHKVRVWLNQQDFTQHVADGRATLERELHRLNLDDTPLDSLVKRFQAKDLDNLLASIAKGEINTAQIAGALREQVLPKPTALPLRHSDPKAGSAGVSIQGVSGLLSQTAKCCSPLPGDTVIGFVTRERGVSVHRRDCPNVRRWLDEGHERLLEVEWNRADALVYPVDVEVVAYDRIELLRDIANVFAAERINITATRSGTDRRDNIARLTLSIEVNSAEQLSRILHRLEDLPNVLEAQRLRVH